MCSREVGPVAVGGQVGVRRRPSEKSGNGEGVAVLAGEWFELASRAVLVVGMFLHVLGAQSFRLVDERSLVFIGQQLPVDAESLGDLRIVHLRILLRHLATLAT